MRVSAALVAVAATAVMAQVPQYGSPLNMTLDPGTVEDATRASWCSAEYNTCQTLCDGDTSTNNCVQADLSYECICASNSSAPGLEYYTQTMPTFICNELFGQCNEQNANDQEAQDDCATNIGDLCATQTPPKDSGGDDDDDSGDSDSTTSTAATTASAPTSEATGSDDTVTTTNSDGLAAPTMAPAGHGAAAAAAVGLLAYLV